MADNLTGKFCCSLGFRDCGHCTQSVCCAPCVYATAYEKAAGVTETNEDLCGFMPVPATGFGKGMCCFISMLDIIGPITGVFAIRTSNNVGQSCPWACAAEFCPMFMCYGSPCHMNAYRKNLAAPTKGMHQLIM